MFGSAFEFNCQIAIPQAWTGKGFVVVAGRRLEAAPLWQADSGVDSDGTDYLQDKLTSSLF